MARAGLDWILMDMEHGAIDAEMAHAMIAATSGTPMVPLVRVADAASWQAKLPLDLGALGICFPMTTTRAAAAAAVRAVRYAPLGERFWGPFYAPPRWGYPCGSILIARTRRSSPSVRLNTLTLSNRFQRSSPHLHLISCLSVRRFGNVNRVEGRGRSPGGPCRDLHA